MTMVTMMMMMMTVMIRRHDANCDGWIVTHFLLFLLFVSLGVGRNGWDLVEMDWNEMVYVYVYVFAMI